MTNFYASKLIDVKGDGNKQRRSRHILAASGRILESGEVRDLNYLYVMGRDGELYKISDLNRDLDKQAETYSVKAQADHGELIDDELVPTIEKQFGSCKVWLEEDGLHARMYFANDDPLADHAWAISDDASYSTGIDWYPQGYYGAGQEIKEPIGILREISMVLTGNDPRAKTIDTKSSKVASGDAVGDNNTKPKKGLNMVKKIDQLTPDERAAFGRELEDLLDKFTTNVPESETQPTARDTKDEAEGADKPAEEKTEATETSQSKDTKVVHNNVLLIKDRVAKQEAAVKTTDWLTSEAGHNAFSRTLKQAGKFGPTFDSLWRAEASKHTSLDDISGLPTPSDIVSMWRDALEKSDGIISHFEFVSSKGLRINLIGAVSGQENLSRANGHKPGDTKVNQSLANTVREILCKMVYKRLPLDAMDLWENPGLIDFRARELVDAIVVEIERAAIIGDGRSEPATGQPDLRMYDSTTGRGFVSIKSDAAASTGIGSLVASTLTPATGDNAYDTIVKARGLIRSEGRQFIVAKASWVSAVLTTKIGSDYLVAPGTRIEDVLGVVKVYTPAWMETDTANDAYLIVDKAYKMVGQNSINSHPDFDTSTNSNILLDETPRGGALGEYKSAVAIATPTTPAE